jgi:prepilin-type N-terminal cleavage/methylation domain-containing protein
MNKQNGLTLIELAIVLAVISIVSAGVVMSFRQVDRRLLNDTSIKLQADFRYAQRRAIMEGHKFGIEFASNSYKVVTLGVRMEHVELKTVELPDGVRFIRYTEPFLYYLPRGTISEGSRILLNKGRYNQELTTTLSGGRVRIWDIVSY